MSAIDDLIKGNSSAKSAGTSAIDRLLLGPTPQEIQQQKIRQLQHEQKQALQISQQQNSFGGLLKSTFTPSSLLGGAKKVGNTLYDIGGGIIAPGITQEELRNPQILKDTVLGIPRAVAQTTKQAVTHPIQTAQSVVGGTARGVSDTITGIITNLFVPKEYQEQTSVEVKNILDKYLGATPENNIQQGFQVGGQAAPYVAAGGILGELGGAFGAKIGGSLGQATRPISQVANQARIGSQAGSLIGNTTGFVGMGQASIPTDSTLEQRAEQAAHDLAGLGLFMVGSAGYAKAKNLIAESLKTPPPTPVKVPISTPVDIKNETPREQRVMINPRKVEVKNKTPNEVPIDTFTPYTPPEKLPSIQLGGYAKPKPELPQIQLDEPFTKLKERKLPDVEIGATKEKMPFEEWATGEKQPPQIQLQPKAKPVDLGYTVEPIKEPVFERSTKPGIEGKWKIQSELPQTVYDTFNEFKTIPRGRLILKPQDLVRTEIRPSTEVKSVTGAGENPVSFTRLSIKHLAEKGMEGERLLRAVPEILSNPETIYQGTQASRYLISKSIKDASGRPHAVILEVTENNGNIIVTAFKTDSTYLQKFDLLWRAGVPEGTVPPSQRSSKTSGGSTLSDLRGDQVSRDIAKPILAKPTEAVNKPILGKESRIKSRTTTILKPIEGTGATKTRGLSQGVEVKALQNDLTKGFGDLPDYKQVNMRDQAVRANNLLMRDIEGAKAIAMGEKAPPKGLLPESVFVALEKQALRDGDVAMLRRLATDSKLTSAATTLGQRIRTLGERDVDSPVGAIADIIKAREEALKGKDIPQAKKEVVSQIKSEIKKVRVPKETWASFIDKITC